MDNFRKFKAPRGRQNTNVDGFFSSTSAGQRVNQPASRFRAHTPAGGHIGSFKSTDGFHPAEQQRISSTSSPLGRQPQRRQDGGINLTMPAEPVTRRRGGRTKRGVKGWSKSAMKLSAGLLVSGVLVGGYLFGKAYLTARQVLRGGTAGAAALQENVDPTKLNGEGDG
jgi:hypothetical protein